MIGKNIRYYRQLLHLSQDGLASLVGVKKMAISNYESGKRMPDAATLLSLARALRVPLPKLMARRDERLCVTHGAFRKKASIGKQQQELILEHIDRYLNRLYCAVFALGDAVLPPCPQFERQAVTDCESAGRHLRCLLGLAPSGPVGNIVDILENRGVIVCPVDIDDPRFSGNSGTVNGRPYIAINAAMPAERQRFTVIHELAHLAFSFSEDQDEEKLVDGIAGAFLLPKEDLLRELGPKRRDIRGDLRFIQREYGVSMASVIVRARQTGIITERTYEITQKWFSAQGLRTDERSGLAPEKSRLLEKLVLRAVSEEELGLSKAAELMSCSLEDARRLCYGGV